MVPGKYGNGSTEYALETRFVNWQGPGTAPRSRKALLGLKLRGLCGVDRETGSLVLGIRGSAVVADFARSQSIVKYGGRGSSTAHLIDRAMRLAARL